MTIEKNTKNVLRHEAIPFTTIFNSVLQNIHHTGALGLYCYLASKPNDWIIDKDQLQKHFDCGKDHIYKCWNYLKNLGLIEVYTIRNEKGQVVKWDSILKRTISTQKSPESENPESGLDYNKNNDFIQILENQESGEPGFNDNIYIQIKENTTTSEPPVDNFATASSSNNFFSEYKQLEKDALQKQSDELNQEALAAKFKDEAINDTKCKQAFQERFSGLDVTIEELYDSCSDYWEQRKQLAYKARFLSHIKRCPTAPYQPIAKTKSSSYGDNTAFKEISEFNKKLAQKTDKEKQQSRLCAINATRSMKDLLAGKFNQKAVAMAL